GSVEAPQLLEYLLSVLPRHGGHVLRTSGRSALAQFGRPGDALACAMATQRALGRSDLRIALHTGREAEASPTPGSHGASETTEEHTTRILIAAHGGQILCSEAAAGLLRRSLEPGVRLVDLGSYRLRNEKLPERLFQIDAPELPRREF